jgi:hypothetical protein
VSASTVTPTTTTQEQPVIDDDDTPSPHQIADDPELAIFAVLDTALKMATNTLLAQHPPLCAELQDRCHGGPPSAWIAEALLAQARALAETLQVYRYALHVADQRRMSARGSRPT